MDLDGLQRTFFDSLYTYRFEVAVATVIVTVVVLVFAWRLGWFAAARRHPARAGALVVVLLAVALPIGYYTASPLWIRTVLIEPAPAVVVAATPTPVAPAAHPSRADHFRPDDGTTDGDPVLSPQRRLRDLPRHR